MKRLLAAIVIVCMGTIPIVASADFDADVAAAEMMVKLDELGQTARSRALERAARAGNASSLCRKLGWVLTPGTVAWSPLLQRVLNTRWKLEEQLARPGSKAICTVPTLVNVEGVRTPCEAVRAAEPCRLLGKRLFEKFLNEEIRRVVEEFVKDEGKRKLLEKRLKEAI